MSQKNLSIDRRAPPASQHAELIFIGTTDHSDSPSSTGSGSNQGQLFNSIFVLGSPRLQSSSTLKALCALLVSAAAYASDAEHAERLFNEARSLMSAGRFDEACPKFEQSHELDPALGTLLNAAACAEKQNQLAKAYRQFGEANRWAIRSGEQRRQEVAQKRLSELRSRVTLVAIDVGQTKAIAQLQQRVEGGKTFDFVVDPLEPFAVEPGEYRLTVTAPGRVTFEADLEFRKPGEIHVLAPLSPLTAKTADVIAIPPAAVPSKNIAAPPPSRMWAYTGLGAGIVLGLAGGVGIAYSQSVMTRVTRQQPGGPDFTVPTVTRLEFQTAQFLYPSSVVSAVLGLGTFVGSWLWLSHQDAPTTAAVIPLEHGFLVAAGGRF
jgi:hypothetical protein